MTCVNSSPIPLADLLDIVETALATVSRRLPAHVARDDLASVGKLTLITLVGQVTGPTDQVRAYCYVRVRGAMLDELRRQDALPRNRRDVVTAISRAQSVLANKLGRAPTEAELAVTVGLPIAVVHSALAASAAEADSQDFEWSTLPDAESPSPVEFVEQSDLQANLRAALERLPPKQAWAIRRYYLEDATLDDIAADLQVSRERARQIREAGENKLRADLVVLSLWQSLLAPR
ncbi:MAG TPA: sigma-70 family RNA polymerase sigma factor [Lacunisphaera sp.]